jgi:hypothetical protein
VAAVLLQRPEVLGMRLKLLQSLALGEKQIGEWWMLLRSLLR